VFPLPPLDSKSGSLLAAEVACGQKRRLRVPFFLAAEDWSRELKAVLLISATPPRSHRVVSSVTFLVRFVFLAEVSLVGGGATL